MSGSWRSKIKALADPVSAEVLPSGSYATDFLLYLHVVEGVRELSKVSFIST